MSDAQPTQMEQRMVTDAMIADEEQFARQLLARRGRELGFTGYADWLEAGCPPNAGVEYPHRQIADICFYVAAARAARPTVDLGEDGELDLTPTLYSEADQDDVPARLKPVLRRAADRLERYREAMVEARSWLEHWGGDSGELGAVLQDIDALLSR